MTQCNTPKQKASTTESESKRAEGFQIAKNQEIDDAIAFAKQYISNDRYIMFKQEEGRLTQLNSQDQKTGKFEVLKNILGGKAFIIRSKNKPALEAYAASKSLKIVQDKVINIHKQGNRVLFDLPAVKALRFRDKSNQIDQQSPEALKQINALDLGVHGEGVKVCVSDSGIDLSHPDLAENIVDDFSTLIGRSSGQDFNGHGTHVAGTIAALNNEIGVVGVAPKAQLIAAKALTASGSGHSSDLAESIYECVARGAQVINMSWGSDTSSPIIEEAIKYAYEQGVVLVAASGNEGKNSVSFPAAYQEVIAVSAVDHQDEFASFSNYGRAIKFSAPGVGIYSTFLKGNYRELDGTSMASPHVAGVMALLLSLNPKATASDLLGDDIGLFVTKQGTEGRINEAKSLNL